MLAPGGESQAAPEPVSTVTALEVGVGCVCKGQVAHRGCGLLHNNHDLRPDGELW